MQCFENTLALFIRHNTIEKTAETTINNRLMAT